MPISPFLVSSLLLFVPYYWAAVSDSKSRTISLATWRWTLLALPSSLLGWYDWYLSGHLDPRIFLLVAGCVGIFFLAGFLWKTGYPSIGGGDILAIVFLMLYVPILPELSSQIFYVFPVLFCTMFLVLAWSFYGKSVPFILPLLTAHAALIGISGIV